MTTDLLTLAFPPAGKVVMIQFSSCHEDWNKLSGPVVLGTWTLGQTLFFKAI